MATTNVTLKVGSVYYELDLDDKKFKEKSKAVKGETKKLGDSFGTLSSSAKSLGAALGVTLSVGALIQGFRSAISAAKELEQSMTGLTRLAARFGEDSIRAKTAAQDLASDGLITVSTAADGLQKLMTAGLGLDQAIELMEGYKDQAAFGRASTISLDQAVGNLAESFYTENSAIGNLSGQTENWNILLEKGAAMLGKKVSQLNAAERAQAKYLAQLQLNKLVEGDAASVTETLGGSLSRLQTETFNLSAAIGTALTPSVVYLVDQMVGAMNPATQSINDRMLVTQSVLLALAGGFTVLAKTAVKALQTIAYASQFNFNAAKESFYDTIGTWTTGIEDVQKRIQGLAEKSYGGMDDVAKASMDNQVQLQDEKARKIAKSLEDETYNFQKQMDQRNKAFAESLADMIWSHLDKVDELKSKIKEETEDFNANMEERAKKFKKTMDDMVKNHKKKTADLKEQIANEKKDLEDLEAEKLDDAKDKIAAETREHEKKTSKIEEQINKELSKGKNASQSRLRILREELAEEISEYEYKVQQINAKVDKEVAKAKAASAERVEDLNERLAEESEAFNTAKTEAEQAELEQTAKLKKEHEERLADYNERLAEEEAILSRHQEHVDKVKDKAREDDISRLIRKHQEENEEAEKEHQRRLSDIRNRGNELGNNLAKTFAQGLLGGKGAIDNASRQIGDDAGNKVEDAIKPSARDAGRALVQSLIDGIRDRISGAYNYVKEQFSNLSEFAKSRIPGFASGVRNFKGGLAVVGERGPELVRLPPGSDVIPNEVAFGSGASAGVNSTINNNNSGVTQDIRVFVDKVSDMSDIDALGREFGFRASLMPGLKAG